MSTELDWTLPDDVADSDAPGLPAVAASDVDVLDADLAAGGLAQLLGQAVGGAFLLAEHRKGRNPHALSMSRLGGCSRAVAFRVAETPPTDPDLDGGQKRQAWLGTWQHRGLLPNLRLKLRKARTEVPCAIDHDGLHLPGHADLWWRRARGRGDVVVDVKTVKAWALNSIREHGVRERDAWQVDGYALALHQTYDADVRWTAVLYLDRATGDAELLVRPFGDAEAQAVLDRLDLLVQWKADPLDAPRDEDGPGLSWACDHCPWLRACWGADAAPGDSSAVALDPDDADAIAAAAAAYAAARAAIKVAEAQRDAARAQLDRARPGVYGDWRVGWGKSSPGGNVSGAKAWTALGKRVDLLELAALHDVELPTTAPKAGAIQVELRGEPV